MVIHEALPFYSTSEVVLLTACENLKVFNSFLLVSYVNIICPIGLLLLEWWNLCKCLCRWLVLSFGLATIFFLQCVKRTSFTITYVKLSQTSYLNFNSMFDLTFVSSLVKKGSRRKLAIESLLILTNKYRESFLILINY